jgi:uncharacterized repeat protein (TIGR01451 family)
MKRSYLFILFLLTILYFVNPIKTFADTTTCQPIYGGGQTCVTTNNIAIDKTVLNPQTNNMVDNLGINDPKYQPGDVVTFQIKITNTSNSTFSNVDVTDIFPQYLSFITGPGNFNANTGTLTFSISDLKASESRAYTVTGKAASADAIPFANGNICVVNQATAKSNNNDVAQDNSQFCIAKSQQTTTTTTSFPVLSSVPITTTPKTGPEPLGLLAMVPSCIIGLIMREYSLNRKGKN